MAISGSTNFSMTCSEIISSSFRILGVGMNGETPTAEESNNARQVLNMLLKFHSKKALKLWMVRTQSIIPVAGVATYTLGVAGSVVMPRPVSIISVYRKEINGSALILDPLSFDDYQMLPTKSSAGIPSQYVYDQQLNAGKLILWPVPDTAAPTTYTIEVNYKKPIDDVDNVTDDIEIPQEWYMPLRWALAYDLMAEFDLPPDKQNRISSKSQRLIEEVQELDIEEGTSLYIHPMRRL